MQGLILTGEMLTVYVHKTAVGLFILVTNWLYFSDSICHLQLLKVPVFYFITSTRKELSLLFPLHPHSARAVCSLEKLFSCRKICDNCQRWKNVSGRILQSGYDYQRRLPREINTGCSVSPLGYECTSAVPVARVCMPAKAPTRPLHYHPRNEEGGKQVGFGSDIGSGSAVHPLFGFAGKDVYPSAQEKAANLLYLVTKNHAFSDGNKRIAAAVFLYFLERNCLLFRDGEKVIADHTLVAMVVMIAESKPEEKETMVKLVMNFLDA